MYEQPKCFTVFVDKELELSRVSNTNEIVGGKEI